MDVAHAIKEGIKHTNHLFGHPEGQTMKTIRGLEKELIFLDDIVTKAGSQTKGAISKVWYPSNLKQYHKLVKEGNFQILNLPQLYRDAIEHYALVCKRYKL